MMNYSTNVLMISILIVISVIPLVALGFFSLDVDKKTIEEKQLDHLQSAVQSQKDIIQVFFTEKLSDITFSTKIPFIQNNIHVIFENDSEKDEKVIETFKSLFLDIRNTYNYETIWILDNTFQPKLVMGSDLGLSQFQSHLKNFLDAEQMSRGLYLSDVYLDSHQNPELFVSIPLLKDDVLLGYIVYDVRLGVFFKENLIELDLTDTGETVVAQKQNDNIFFIKQLRFDESTPLSESLMAFESDLPLPSYEASLGIPGSGYSIDYRGEKVLAVWDYVPLTRWGIVAKIDTVEAFSSISQKQTDLQLVIFSLITISFILGLFLSRVAILPLMKIKNASTQISKKNYNVVIPLSGPIEQRAIIRSFNDMTTSLKENEKEIKKHLETIQEIDFKKSEFAAMTSHELKTPLVPILGYCQMLLESGLVGELNDKQKEFAEKIKTNSDSLLLLIEKMLSIHRLEMGTQTWIFETQSIQNILKNVHECHLPMMKAKNIQFTIHPSDDQKITVAPKQLQELFTNIIQNAVDFVPDNGAIEINAKNYDDYVEFSVKDNGSGIPKDKQKHLFEKFYQVDTSITRKHGGTGLGLAICKGIIDNLGGKIWVESKEREGSIFFFSIPKNHPVSKS